MARKSQKTNLVEIMQDNNDLAVVEEVQLQARIAQPLVGDPTCIADGHGPELPPEITALLVMAGLQARWSINFWLLVDKHGRRGHVSARGDFEEWQGVINGLVGAIFGTNLT